MLKIAVLGSGRMAQGILQVIDENDQCLTSGVWIRDEAKINAFRRAHQAEVTASVLLSANLSAVLATADIAIDFTLAQANQTVLEQVLAIGLPLVCGVSGLDTSQDQSLTCASAKIPVLYDRNMSLGIAVLNRMLRDVGPAFAGEFVAEVHESHHRHKKDAPSGTALLLGETLAESRGQSFEDACFYDPSGGKPDSSDKIGFFVTREGETPGDHKVTFSSPSETIQLSHSVADRRVFAEGAVKAALWLAERPAGLYRMSDVLVE
jgi:4-hydroxy-tetrahydrodipicolinate reductase